MRKPDTSGTQVWRRTYTYLAYDGFIDYPPNHNVQQSLANEELINCKSWNTHDMARRLLEEGFKDKEG